MHAALKHLLLIAADLMAATLQFHSSMNKILGLAGEQNMMEEEDSARPEPLGWAS